MPESSADNWATTLSSKHQLKLNMVQAQIRSIWLDDVGCSGNESDIADCSHNGWGVVGLCDHSEDAGVKCSGILQCLC